MKETIPGRLLVLSIITLASILAGAMIAPIETRFLSKVTGSSTLASFAFTVATVASILGTVLLSRFANKYGRSKVIYSAFIIGIFFPLLYSLIQNMFQAYGIKFAWAFAAAGTGTLLRAFIQEEVSVFKGREGTFFGIFYAVQAGTGAIGTFAGGCISDAFGFSGVFCAVFLIYVIQSLMVVIFYRASKDFQEPESKEKGNLVKGVEYIWKNRYLRARFVLITVFGMNWSTKAILYPLILFAVSGHDSITGAIFSLQGITALIILPFIGIIIDKFDYAKVLFIGYVLLGIGVLIFSLVPYTWLVWAASVMVAAGEACNGPAMSKLETVNIPDYLRNSVVAVQDIFSTAVELSATFITGLMLLVFNPKAIMLFMAVLIFAAIAISVSITRNTNQETDFSITA